MYVKSTIAMLLSLLVVGQPCVAAPEMVTRAQTPFTPIALTTTPQIDGIYQHLLTHHWVPRTGLFLSFVDSTDKKLSQQASTYDQAATGLLAIRFGDLDRARGLLRF